MVLMFDRSDIKLLLLFTHLIVAVAFRSNSPKLQFVPALSANLQKKPFIGSTCPWLLALSKGSDHDFPTDLPSLSHPLACPGLVAPPEPLASLPVGSSLRAFRSVRSLSSVNHANNITLNGELEKASVLAQQQQQQHPFQIERVAIDPPIFILRNVLTVEECDYVRACVSQHHQMQAETVTPGDHTSRTNCQVAWLSNKWTQDLARSLGNLLLSPAVKSHPKSGVEDLQILEYQSGGEFILHHDGEPRILTLLYYLNGVGKTWFPLAITSTRDIQTQKTFDTRPANKVEALKQCKSLESDHGICVGDGDYRIEAGDAVAFYNYVDDGSENLNWNAIHAGLPVDGTEKWVANHWFRFGGKLSDL